MKLNLPSPIEKIYLNDRIGEIIVKRDDLIHPFISGNKWRKLKGIIQNFKGNELITFGGAFSNHLLAVASYASLYGMKSKGIIRGNELDESNPTLSACVDSGMKLEFIDRDSYRKRTSEIHNSLLDHTKEQLFIPEGGTTLFAKIGMQELVDEIKSQVSNVNVFCSYGTGGTALGIGSALDSEDHLSIVPAIKGLSRESILENQNLLNCSFQNFKIEEYLSMKRYAAKDLDLFEFCEEFLIKHALLLDPIYTSKVMYFLSNHFTKKNDQEIVFIHTGGIQAWKGYFYRFPNLKTRFKNIYSEISK